MNLSINDNGNKYEILFIDNQGKKWKSVHSFFSYSIALNFLQGITHVPECMQGLPNRYPSLWVAI